MRPAARPRSRRFSRRAACRAGHGAVAALSLGLLLAGGCAGTAPTPVDGAGPAGGAAKAGAPTRPSSRPPAARDRWPRDPGQPGAARADCRLPDAPVDAGGSFTIALTDSVRPHLAPVPRNRAERLVFAQLYETLVQVDCSGAAAPGLAEQWTCGADSLVWVFTLRQDARTWDGRPLTAKDVWRSWQDNRAAPVDDGASPWNWFDPRTGSVSALDARRLAVRLPEPQRAFPLLLAHPATAVAVRRPGWAWPLGSGPCRLTQADGAPRPLLTLRPHAGHPRAPRWDALAFRVTPGLGVADAVAAAGEPGIDLVWTRDLRAVRGLSAQPGWQAQPLPWDRVQVLVCPPALGAEQAARWFGAGDGLLPEQDVRDVAARSWPALTLPAADGRHCPQLSGPVAADRGDLADALTAALAASPATIVYPADDPAARDLAGRLAELAGADARAVPLPPNAAAAALRRGEACASVVPIPQSYADGCLQMAALLSRAAWLQQAGLAEGDRDIDAVLAAARVARSLAVTRAWLLTRANGGAGLGGITLHYDACPDLAGLGRLAAAAGR